MDREFRGLVKRMRSGEGDAIAAEINELGHHLMRLAGGAWPEFLEHLAELVRERSSFCTPDSAADVRPAVAGWRRLGHSLRSPA